MPNFPKPVTEWKPYKVKVTYLQQENELREYESPVKIFSKFELVSDSPFAFVLLLADFSPNIEDYVPLDTGFGTTHAPERAEPDFETTYLAWVLYVLSRFLSRFFSIAIYQTFHVNAS